MYQITYRVPGEMTLFETDEQITAIAKVSDLYANPDAEILSVEYVAR